MNDTNTDFLINNKTLRITLYLSLVIGHLIFGVIYPEAITLAAVGFTFFAALVLFQLRPAYGETAPVSHEHGHPIRIEKPVRADK